MKKNRLIFYGIFGAFHLFLVFFTFYIEGNKNDFAFLTKMLKWMSVMRYGAIFGLCLLIVDIVWNFIALKDYHKENAGLTHEINTLKAKLFDLQEATKDTQAQADPNSK